MFMRKLFVIILLAMAGTALADDVQRPCATTAGQCVLTSKVPQGSMPPRWLLNKVTPAQYDTLVALNRLCHVDYSMLKSYDVTPEMVSRIMGQAREELRKAIDKTDGTVSGTGWIVARIKTIKPWRETVEKGVRKVEYLVYSSVDGYDVHLLLRASLQRDRRTGVYRSVSYELVPYSIQGIPVKIERAEVSKVGSGAVSCLEIGSDGKSTSYAISAALEYTDPLGNKHIELVSTSVHLQVDL